MRAMQCCEVARMILNIVLLLSNVICINKLEKKQSFYWWLYSYQWNVWNHCLFIL